MDIKDCPGQLKVTVGQLNFPPLTCPTGQIKFEPSFMLKAVVGTENTANEY